MHIAFCNGRSFSISTKLSTAFWSSAGTDEKFHQWLSALVAERSELLLLATIFKEWFLRVASFCFYIILTNSYLLSTEILLFFDRSYNDFHMWEAFLFWGLGASFNTILFFSHLFRVTSPGNLSPYQGTLFLLSDFPKHAACVVNPREQFPQTICHHKRGTCSTWVVFIDKHYHSYSWFLKVNSPFQSEKKLINSSSHG